jgi:predicted unusual protein kinase regulating ubiquinone biosynthesis (AarF/ABC1/UbiB family)
MFWNQIEDVFTELSVGPVAAASLGQVCTNHEDNFIFLFAS